MYICQGIDTKYNISLPLLVIWDLEDFAVMEETH